MDELTREQCVELVRSEPVGHLGVVDGENPYVTPVSFVLIDGTIGMRVGPGRRVDALRNNSRGCFEVSVYDTESGAWESAIAEGTIRILSSGREAELVISELLGKYRSVVSTLAGTPSVLGQETILVLDIEHLTGRSSGSFFAMRTRPGRL